METYGVPALFAVLVWWWSTGAILWLVSMPRRYHPALFVGGTLLLPMAVWGVVTSGANANMFGAYLGFAAAIGVWAWHEMAFLLGYVTGPNTEHCPADARGWRRFRAATRTVIYHEIALAVTAAALVWLLWDSPNQVAAWTFLVLWIMRLSAKLNVYFGVPNMAEEFLQPHLAYMSSYFRKRPVTPLFSVAVTAATAVAVLVVLRMIDSATPMWETAALGLAGTLLLLAIIEHWFLVLPVREAILWRWAQRKADTSRPASAPRPHQGSAPNSEVSVKCMPAGSPQTALLRPTASTAS